MSFIDYFCVYKGDRFFGNRGDEAAGKPIDESSSHFVKLIESAINIDRTVFIATDDMIYHIAHESVSCEIALDADLYILGHFGLCF